MCKKIFLSGLLFFIFDFGFAQTQQLANLKQELETHLKTKGKDSTAIKILIQIFDKVKENQQYYAIEVAGQAMQIAHQIGDKNHEAEMYEWIADIYRRQKVYYLAMDYYFNAIKIYQNIDNKAHEAFCYIELGQTYLEQNVEDLAENYYLKAKEINQKIQNRTGVSMALKNLGKLYSQQENYDKALEQYDKALNFLNKKQVKQTAEILEEIAKVHIAEDEPDKAHEFLYKALVKYKLSDSHDKVADIYLQYGKVYVKQKQYEIALENLEKALFIDNELKRYNQISEIYNRFSYIYYRQKKYKDAIKQAQNALNFNNNYLEGIQKSYLYMSRAYAKLENNSDALKYLKKYLKVHNRIFEDKENKQFTEMQVSLELQRHEKEVEILKRDQAIQEEALKRSRLQTYFLLFGLLVILLFAYYYYRTNRKTKLANLLLQKQKEEILKQKEELTRANKAILEQQRLIELKNKDIQSGINYAHRIQFALIPDMNDFSKILPNSFIYLRPKDKISGDFYWFTRKRHLNKIFVAAVDCTGHGIPGAFMSVLGNTLLNQILYMGIYEADEILNNLHKMIRKSLHQETTPNRDGMDMALCVIDNQNHTLEYAGAKNPLVYFENNEMKVIKGNIFSIGGIQREKIRKFTKHSINYTPGSTFYIYSDGIQDQFGGDDKQKFTRNRLRKILQDNYLKNFDEQKAILHNEIDEWKQNFEQIDDMLLIGFKL